MNLFLKENRNEAIESLEFFYFLKKLFRSLKSAYEKITNPLILNFLKSVESFYLGESKKISRLFFFFFTFHKKLYFVS